MSELELEPETHTYTFGGVEVPGCTSVLQAMGAVPSFSSFLSPEDLKFYQSRGHAVIKAIELMIHGTLDRRTLGKWMHPYLIGWDRFCNDFQVEVIQFEGAPFVERKLYHPAYRYGVTPDVVAKIKRSSGPIEVKATSQHGPATAIQTAAQLIAVRQAYPDIGDARYAVRLFPEEPYFEPKCYRDKSDEGVWLSLLNSYNWLKANKRLKGTNHVYRNSDAVHGTTPDRAAGTQHACPQS